MKTIWSLVPLSLALTVATAQDTDSTGSASKEAVAAALAGVEVENISDSPIDGIYQVTVGSNVGYVTADGRYLMQGELFDLQSNQNLTEATRSTARVGLLASVDPAQMIVFSPPDGEVKHAITIFTDIDCGYCRQFHREIEQVNAMGIQVSYLFYPRTGPDTDSWTKAEQVWCAADRNTALTSAKLGGSVPENSCAANPVASHYDLGREVGVRGTPAVFTASGENIGGYLPPATLLQRLESPGL